MCLEEGCVTPGDVVDHVIPHKGDEELFFSSDNLASLCKRHHDGEVQRVERGGVPTQRIGADGWPLINEGSNYLLKKKSGR